MALGVLGGTFDPIHWAHLILAQEAQGQLGLGRVLFVPAGQPWRKAERPIAAAHHRLAMLRLALADAPAFEISTLELERRGPSYTVDTLHALSQELGPGEEIFFILGQDALYDLPHWREPERIIALARLAVAARPGWLEAQGESLEDLLPGLSRRVVTVAMPLLEISASGLRERIRQGLPWRYFVPPPVAEYIQEHGLYGG